MSNSRLIKSSGGDHPNLTDWEAFVTDAANYNDTDWDDTVEGHGGDQIVRLANEGFSESNNAIDVDALATATNYRVTIRPDVENGVTAVGAKVAVDGSCAPGLLKTPWVASTANHTTCLNLSTSTDIEWHVEDISTNDGGNDRLSAIRFSTGLTRDCYVDRCILRKATSTSNNRGAFHGGPSSGSARIYVRSCIASWVEGPLAGGEVNANGYAWQGCTFWWDGTAGTAFATSNLPTDIYGCAIGWHDADGVSKTGTNATSNFNTDFNVTNLAGTSWTSDFDGAGDVANETQANMFASASGSAISDLFPLASGALDGAVTWSGLPADIKAAWPDTDFIGQAITKSGVLTAGAIQLASAAGTIAPQALHHVRMRSAA